jgi:polysaccharide pyruvyl transferase WcaK-like protein
LIYNICGFYGYGNLGDEGILYAIMDTIRSIDKSPAFMISTTLNSELRDKYHQSIQKEFPEVLAIRDTYDTRNDYDVFILGGGNLNWGYGWRLALSAFASGKKTMNYGVGYTPHIGAPLYHKKLNNLYRDFLNQFDVVTVRDDYSYRLLREMGAKPYLTMCPAFNLLLYPDPTTEKYGVVVCPRFEDSDEVGKPVSNKPQIDWIVERLKQYHDKVTFLPMAENDLQLCKEIKYEIPNPSVIIRPETPRKAKKIISRSSLVISGGRYHAVLWSIAHNIPHELAPTNRYDKTTLLMINTSNPEHLYKRELVNKTLLEDLINNG